MAVPFSQKPSMPKTITEPNRDAELGGANKDKSVPQVANDNARPLPAYREERTTTNAKVSLGAPANDNNNNRPFPAYLLDRSARRREAGHLFEFNQMRSALADIDGTGVYVPDALKPYHITCNEFYYGAATPKAIEKPHWHFQGWEVYLVLEGEAEMLVKWHEEVDWQRRVLRPHDSIVIAPGCCHWLRWQTNHGYVVVFKAPTIPGIGKPPNGKQMCTNGCHLYKNGCVLPDGYNPD